MTVLYKHRSSKQLITLSRLPGQGLALTLDGAYQFTELTEARYHECLAVVPLLYRRAETVFIGGGGDGLLAARLLPFPEVRSILVCDHDPEVTDLARTHPDLSTLNKNSLDDSRVHLIHQDAVEYLEKNSGLFDLICLDFPDPYTESLGRLFSYELYELIKKRLSPQGIMCTQTLFLPRSRALIIDTLKKVFSHVLYYQTHHKDGLLSGYTMASVTALEKIRPCPDWTDSLNEEILPSLFDPIKELPSLSAGINTVRNNSLFRTAILEVYWNRSSYPHPFNPDVRVVDIDRHNPCPVFHMPGFLREAARVQPLVAYVERERLPMLKNTLEKLGLSYKRSYRRMIFKFTPEIVKGLERTWNRLDNGTISQIESFVGPTSRHEELSRVVKEYLRDYRENFLDLEENPLVLEQDWLHLLVRDHKGEPRTLMVISEGTVVEILYGRGSPRQNMLGLVMCLKFLSTYDCPTLTFEAATPNVEGFMAKIGAEPDYYYDVYVKETDPTRHRGPINRA